MGTEPLLPPHGGYRRMRSFQVAQLVYDVTVRFCDRYVDRRSRTHDQMVQAARSGVQNIAEGSEVSATSKKMELKLTQVARASLEELKLDYEDFLRQHGLRQWERQEGLRQELVEARPRTVDEVASWVAEAARRQRSAEGKGAPGELYPELSANAALTLATVAGYLLDRQIRALGEGFEAEGGFTERLHGVRSAKRRQGMG